MVMVVLRLLLMLDLEHIDPELLKDRGVLVLVSWYWCPGTDKYCTHPWKVIDQSESSVAPCGLQALERGYSVYFQEPDTAWKFDPAELEK